VLECGGGRRCKVSDGVGVLVSTLKEFGMSERYE